MRALPVTTMAVALAWARPAAAEPLRLVWVSTAEQAPLVARVEGQLADLPVALDVVTAAPLPAGLDEARARALAVARGRAGAAALWLVADGDGWIVHVASADGARLLVRRVDARAEGLDPSAALESAALIVRTAARGLAAGVAIGDEVPRQAPRWRAWGQLGGRGGLDGPGASASLELGLGLARGRVRLGLGYRQAAPAVIDDDDASVELRRLSIEARGALVLATGPRWRGALVGGVGAERTARTTTATGPGVTATEDAATWTPLAAVGGALGLRLAGGVWLEGEVGLDAAARPPRFTVASSAGERAVASSWPVRPWLALALTIETGP